MRSQPPPGNGGERPTVFHGPASVQHFLRARQQAGRPGVFREIETVPTGEANFDFTDALAAVVQAQSEAQQILDQAESDARAVRAQAAAEAAQSLLDARAEGYAHGREQAAREADARVAEESQAYVDALRADLAAFCDAVLGEQQRAWQQAESQLTHVALDIASRVIKAELAVSPDVVVQIVRHALRRLQNGCDHLRIRVNPDDVERLRERREEFLTTFEGVRQIEITEDRRVGIGGAQIETDGGTLDARIETQIAEITRALEAA